MLLALAVSAIAASSVQGLGLGVSPDLTWGIGRAAQTEQALAIRTAGADWVRLNVEWGPTEPAPGVYSEPLLRYYDDAVRSATDNGLKVVMLVSGSPPWASRSTDDATPPRNPSSFAAFTGMLARRWAGRIAWWEIWNEENISRFWPGGPDPVAYTRLLRASAFAIRTADPHARILFGGTSGSDPGFLRAAYRAGARGSFDGVGVHPYTCGPPGAEFEAYHQVRRVLLAHGDRLPLLMTEMGWSTTSRRCGVSGARQASYLTRAMTILAGDRYVAVALWYMWRDAWWMHGADRLEARFGLLRANGNPKPALQAFCDAARDKERPSQCAGPLSPAALALSPTLGNATLLAPR